MPRAFCFDLAKAGRSKDAKIAMMAMTTNNSIRVNALCFTTCDCTARSSFHQFYSLDIHHPQQNLGFRQDLS
jgi:hypothetical protein